MASNPCLSLLHRDQAVSLVGGQSFTGVSFMSIQFNGSAMRPLNVSYQCSLFGLPRKLLCPVSN